MIYIPVNPIFPYIKWPFPGCPFHRLINEMFMSEAAELKSDLSLHKRPCSKYLCHEYRLLYNFLLSAYFKSRFYFEHDFAFYASSLIQSSLNDFDLQVFQGFVS